MIEQFEYHCFIKYLFSTSRFAKGTSETRKTIEDLRNKGVKVDLGIPDTLWNEPSAPVQALKKYVSL